MPFHDRMLGQDVKYRSIFGYQHAFSFPGIVFDYRQPTITWNEPCLREARVEVIDVWDFGESLLQYPKIRHLPTRLLKYSVVVSFLTDGYVK